ncbi:MAG: PD40 domain-containing protein [Bacteroidales bacterium]|nr:PD40 domain-containing protein [Bacteroidales bacterium]
MKLREIISGLFILVCGALLCIRCGRGISEEKTMQTGRKPLLEPDYSDVTIPPNIAPMNFCVSEGKNFYRVFAKSGTSGYQIRISSRNGIIRFPGRSWRKLLNNSKGDKIKIQIYSAGRGDKTASKYDPFYLYVSDDPIDPYLVYRLIHPGYYSWSNIRIVQRSLESFEETSLFENRIMEKNCANCHSFNNNRADRFMIHIRGSLGGTYFAENGILTRTDPKIDGMPGSATYPTWHPGGRFMAFSSNQVRQSFYSIPEKNIEVFDLISSLILYDREKNEIISITDSDTTKYLQTFPSWSPDGKYLYFCRAPKHISEEDPELEQIRNTHYDLVRKSFDHETRTFGEAEIVFNAAKINKSVSFPRISPDGKSLVITLADYGTFPVWHREADLYMLNLQTGEAVRMNVNSDETESYHTWSVNGRWLVFSSRRMDGRSGRPYFTHIDSLGNQGKPFVLPQEDPALYGRMLESFNIPEFVNGRIKLTPRDFASASRQIPLKALSGNPPDSLPAQAEKTKEIPLKINERPIHQ